MRCDDDERRRDKEDRERKEKLELKTTSLLDYRSYFRIIGSNAKYKNGMHT